jgi:hypothetical protein
MDPEQEIAIYLRSKGVQHAVLKDMLDQFAHNLAEAIRQECKKVCILDDPCTCAESANLIDPETGHTESGR